MFATMIFDFDGTIVDSFEHTFAEANKIADREQLRKVRAIPHQKLRDMSFLQIIRYYKIPLYKIPALLVKIRRQLRKKIDIMEPIEQVPQILRDIHEKGVKLGLLTSNSRGNVTRFLARYNLSIFDYRSYSSGLLSKQKKIKAMIRKYNLDRSSLIYIGDTTVDIESSKKAGVAVAAVSWGYNSYDLLKKSNPDFLFTSPSELLTLLN